MSERRELALQVIDEVEKAVVGKRKILEKIMTGRNTRGIKYIRVSQNNASGYRHNFQLQVQKCQGSYDSH